ncbi:CynX/NimT family MFS transporter [Delftia tsuruhatensis]
MHPSWIVVMAGVSAALHVGKLPPAVPVLQQQLGVSLLQAGFLLSTVQVAGMLLGLVVGLGADRWGLRRSMLAGLLLMAGASALGAIATGFAPLLALRAVEGLGFLLVAMPGPGLIRRCVAPHDLSARMGWWGTYMPLGSAIGLLLGPWVMAWASWPLWWLLLGLVSALACAAVWYGVPADGPKAPVGTSAAGGVASAPGADFAQPWPLVRGAGLCRVFGTVDGRHRLSSHGLCRGGPGSGVVGHADGRGGAGQHGGQCGIGPSAARRLERIAGAAPGLRLHGFVRAAGLCAMARPAVGTFVAALCCGSCVLGSGGLIPGTLFSMAVRLAPDESTVSTTVGFMQQWSSVGQFAGPPLVAAVAVQAGGWQWTWVVTAAMCAIGWWLAGAIARISAAPARQRERAAA